MKATVLFLAAAGLAVAQTAPDAAEGKKLFEKKCATCHATETDEHRIGPSLKGVKEGRLPDAIGKKATHDNILKQINEGGGGMPVFRDLLTAREKENIVAYVLTL